MKVRKILSTAMLMVAIPSIVFAGGAAPFTIKAGNAIKEVRTQHDANVAKNKPNIDIKDEADLIKHMITYNREIYYTAGYDYDATIREAAEKIKKSKDPIKYITSPMVVNTALEDVVFSLIMFKNLNKSKLKIYFDSETFGAVSYIYDSIVVKAKDSL